MSDLGKLRRLLYRFLAMVVLAAALVVLPTATTSSQTSCCNVCLERFQQCDGTTIVCCKIYNACVQQCQGGCRSCPDQ
jgi:hypothetical protein